MLHFIKCRGCISPVCIPQSPLRIYAMVTIESTFYHFLKKDNTLFQNIINAYCKLNKILFKKLTSLKLRGISYSLTVSVVVTAVFVEILCLYI